MREMNTICRTCLRSSQELLPLFGDTKLPNKIKTIASIEVSDDDNLPKNVCGECVVNINLSYNFRRVIINSDLELRERSMFLLQQHQQLAEVVEDNTNQKDYIITDTVKFENLSKQEEYVNEDLQDQANLEELLMKSDVEIVHDDEDGDNDAKDTDTIQEQNMLPIVKKNKQPRLQRIYKRRERVFKCSVEKCDFKSNNYTLYRRHKDNHDRRICNLCGKSITASNMIKHLSIHTDSPIPCEECGKICKNTESLRGHLILHKGINRTCKICGVFYKERATYIAHLKTHQTVDRSVSCPICDKRLYGKKGLKAHLRSHTGERPYPCEFCKKGFSSSYALKTHRRMHTNERPYKCALCPMAFAQRVSLRTHLKSKHPAMNLEGDS